MAVAAAAAAAVKADSPIYLPGGWKWGVRGVKVKCLLCDKYTDFGATLLGFKSWFLLTSCVNLVQLPL